MESHGGIRYQPALDGLRVFAVAAVIAYHFGAGWAPGGFLGVDAFFVLSGFLITSLLLTEWGRTSRISLPGFWARRARRLLPALLVVLGAIALYAGGAGARVPARHAARRRDLELVLLRELALRAQRPVVLRPLLPAVADATPLVAGDRGAVLPGVAAGRARMPARGSRLTKVLAGVCVAGIAASVAVMALLYEPADPSRAYYGTDARAHTLLVGAVLALILTRRRPERRSSVIALHTTGVVAAGACVWAWVTVRDQGSGLYHGGSFAFAIAVAFVIASAVQPTRRSVWSPLRALLSLGVLRWVGLISYGLYLWHWPATVVLTETRTGLSGAALTLLRLAVTFGAATLSFYLVEQPIRRGALRGWRGRIAVPTGFATAGLVVVVATAGATAASPLGEVRVGEKLTSTPPPAAVQSLSGAPGVAAGTPARILVVGDSVPYTLLPGIQPIAAERGVSVDTALVAGCGVVGGVTTYANGDVPPHAPGCEKVADGYEQTTLDRDHPDLVVWMSTWETYDRIVKGERIRFGGRAWDDMMLGEIDQAARRLTAGGADLVIATMPPRAPNELMTASDAAAETSRFVRLNELYTRYGRAHPETVSVIDFADAVCPGGAPCPQHRRRHQPPPARRPPLHPADRGLGRATAARRRPRVPAGAGGLAVPGPAIHRNGEPRGPQVASPAMTDAAVGGLESAAEPQGPERITFPCFDGFRALAAIVVLVTHVAFLSGFNGRSRLGAFTARMDVGVAIFFMISGFLLYRPFVAARLSGSPGPRAVAYFWRRGLRILPAYWVALTITVFLLHVPKELPSIGDLFLFYGLFHLYCLGNVIGPILSSYTLVTEISFYVFLPLYALAISRWARSASPSAKYGSTSWCWDA